MSLSPPEIIALQNRLRQAVTDCSQRCLYQAARWAAELLDSLPSVNEDDSSLCDVESFGALALPTNLCDSLLEQIETPKYLMAKAFFDCHGFQRCVETLLPASPSGLSTVFPRNQRVQPPRKGISQRGLFLGCYALLIQGEKDKMEEAAHILGPSDTDAVVNKQLPRIRSIIEKWLARDENHAGLGFSQGWLEYLYGMVLAKDQNYDLAKPWLLKSVSINPWNWGAWLELRCLVRDAKDLEWINSHLRPNVMAFIFSIFCRQEIHQTSPSLLSDISQLQDIFPRSSFLQGQRALVYYRMQGEHNLAVFDASSSHPITDFESARSVFSSMLISHPRYLDLVDYWSNVIYTLGSREGLAFIAQLASSVEPYRPETCCAIGNYYSLISRHKDAIIHFRRALLLDRNFGLAWTLLGHEYLKLENTHAALSSYLRAIGLNKQDYKACFCLGQVYGDLGQPKMSLGFYRRALSLRPDEPDLWQAVASCLARLSQFPQAVNSLKKALACTDAMIDPRKHYTGDIFLVRHRRFDMFFQLAGFYEELHSRQEATVSLEKCLGESLEFHSPNVAGDDAHDGHISNLSKAQLFLARWALDDGALARARHFANQVDEPREYREEAQKLLDACAVREDEIRNSEMDIDVSI
ncbi:cell division cycle protein-like protein 23 [Nemania abortiva]|nr:cell division cycle protein-like protein 23 [Nemania abortiva]